MAYSAKDVAGLKVDHDMHAIKDGEQLILTLKDSSILDDKGEGINSDEDILENVNLADNKRADRNKERKKKSKLPRYTAYDDDEFEAAKGEAAGFSLPLPGTFMPGAQTVAEGEVDGPVSFRKKRFVQATDVEAVDDATALAAFDKKAGKKKRRRLRKEKQTKLIRAVERARKAAEAEEGDEGAAAGAGTDGEKAPKKRRVKKKAVGDVDAALLDDDADLMASLARARKLAKAKKATPEAEDDAGAKAVAAAAVEESGAAEAKKPSGGLVFTPAGNFLQQLEARVNEQRAEAQAAAAASAAPVEEEVEEGEAADEDDVEEGEIGSDEDGAVGGSADEKEAPTTNEVIVASGMAATLNLLKRQGDLAAPEQYIGRAKDAAPLWDGEGKDPAPEIKLEYRDPETGLKLTPKEAFRRQCWVFHGIGPGAMQTERRKAQQQNRLNKDGDKRGSVLTALLKQQARKGQAHVALSHKK